MRKREDAEVEILAIENKKISIAYINMNVITKLFYSDVLIENPLEQPIFI